MMISDGKKLARSDGPGTVADAATEAKRVAAAIARADLRAGETSAKAPKAAAGPASPHDTGPEEIPAAAQDTGFDPYNSGSFDRKHAWSKVGKR